MGCYWTWMREDWGAALRCFHSAVTTMISLGSPPTWKTHFPQNKLGRRSSPSSAKAPRRSTVASRHLLRWMLVRPTVLIGLTSLRLPLVPWMRERLSVRKAFT
ncbi:unnamed protein product [Nippostrongylus brasiliensis]|uniref:Uncharacterized protein n=1 Tax=Nippostrongylus brasiliensis TaxID=27835 RepID=A0A0N4XKL4_NIPBR|nr:unnamed protein product [Nippostrongylus brasiliensis]